jgi:RNA polymerase-associated protein RTF1
VPDEHPMEIVADNKMPAPAAAAPTQKKSEDLFSAHDFDIKIDLEVPLPRKLLHFKQNFVLIICSADNPVTVTPKVASAVKDTGPRRSLNLEDYKKKRGLI